MNFHIPHSLYTAMVEAEDEMSPLSHKSTRPAIYFCYQCDKATSYLFADSRCSNCTRLDPDTGSFDDPDDPDQEIENGSALSSKPNHPE